MIGNVCRHLYESILKLLKFGLMYIIFCRNHVCFYCIECTTIKVAPPNRNVQGRRLCSLTPKSRRQWKPGDPHLLASMLPSPSCRPPYLYARQHCVCLLIKLLLLLHAHCVCWLNYLHAIHARPVGGIESSTCDVLYYLIWIKITWMIIHVCGWPEHQSKSRSRLQPCLSGPTAES